MGAAGYELFSTSEYDRANSIAVKIFNVWQFFLCNLHGTITIHT
jgi:hypothetical protein